MEIILKMDPQERYLVYYALTMAKDRLILEPGYQELLERVAALPCGAPGCQYCDPDPMLSDWDEE